MALLLSMILVLTCLGGLTAPSPMPPSPIPLEALKELIGELLNITQDHRTTLCNGSMVWSANLTTGGYCAALESLNNNSCSAIHKTRKMLNGLCARQPSTRQAPGLRDTKIEMDQFISALLKYSRKLFHDLGVRSSGRVRA